MDIADKLVVFAVHRSAERRVVIGLVQDAIYRTKTTIQNQMNRSKSSDPALSVALVHLEAGLRELQSAPPLASSG